MRTSFVFFAGEHRERRFPERRFLHVTRGSVKLYPFPSKAVGLQGVVFFSSLLGLFVLLYALIFTIQRAWAFNLWGIVALAIFVSCVIIDWRWSIGVAFRYSVGKSGSGVDLHVREAKFGIFNHGLRVEAAGEEFLLTVSGTMRRTLVSALELAGQNSNVA